MRDKCLGRSVNMVRIARLQAPYLVLFLNETWAKDVNVHATYLPSALGHLINMSNAQCPLQQDEGTLDEA